MIREEKQPGNEGAEKPIGRSCARLPGLTLRGARNGGRTGAREGEETPMYLTRHVLEAVERHAQQQRGEEDDIVVGPFLRVRGIDKGGAKDEDECEEVHDVGVGEGDAQVHHLGRGEREGGREGGRGRLVSERGD